MGHANLQFKSIELKSENGEKYGEGFVSTTDPDLYNDIVTPNAQKSILKQLLERVIKLDLDHDKFRDPETGQIYEEPKNLIPPGKIVSSELKKTPDGSLGTWVKVQFNKNHSKFKSIINSIKDGFLDGFSIGYTVTESEDIFKNNKIYRNINDLIIRNVALTGDAVNTKASMRIALKSFPKMAEENKKIEELETQLNELKSVNKTLSEENSELKACAEEYKAEKENMDKKKEEEDENKKAEMKSLSDAKDKELSELKSQIEEANKKSEELKSQIEKFENEPQLKSIMAVQAEVKSQLYSEDNKPKLWSMGQ